ncbi:MAG: DNA methyltransferase [Chloroflexi bacterium]|nr:DNA methyltransferase [Chloroflexota bacterium]
MTVAQASVWATRRTGREVTPSNISYLIKYGRIPGIEKNGTLLVSVGDLEQYYQSRAGHTEDFYKRRLGKNLNWHLSFEQFKESETTKHVHRLHPYKGKFIPQLVEYFLDSHTDEFKDEACFQPGDLVLDPFCGSGTTMVQASELGMHAVGIDVSLFNSMISNLKLSKVEQRDLVTATMIVGNCVASNIDGKDARAFEEELLAELKTFNGQFFPAPQFRRLVRSGEIDEDRYGSEKAAEFLPKFNALLEKHNVCNDIEPTPDDFLNTWFLPPVRSEIESARSYIDGYTDLLLRDVLRLILSRTARSSRATTHSDLATLLRPVTETYYCSKHSKICKPLFSMLGWWRRYADDTVKRMGQFQKLRTNTMQVCLTGDSRTIDILATLEESDSEIAALVRKNKIRGIFSSPPYVGLIDYHEQHAYAYELFDLPRNDGAEIGPLSAGRGRQAREAYVEGIASVLVNCQQYMAEDCNVFLVANDKFGLYPRIAALSGMTIAKEYKRPVLNRSEGDKGAYAESIFHMRKV